MTTILKVAGAWSNAAVSAEEIVAVKHITDGGVFDRTLEITLQGATRGEDALNCVTLRKVPVDEATRFVKEWVDFASTT